MEGLVLVLYKAVDAIDAVEADGDGHCVPVVTVSRNPRKESGEMTLKSRDLRLTPIFLRPLLL